MSGGFAVPDFSLLFAAVGQNVAATVALGASFGAVVLASRWGLGVALAAMKKSGK